MPLSKRVLKEYCVSRRTPLSVEMVPLPFLRLPCQTADALRFMSCPFYERTVNSLREQQASIIYAARKSLKTDTQAAGTLKRKTAGDLLSCLLVLGRIHQVAALSPDKVIKRHTHAVAIGRGINHDQHHRRPHQQEDQQAGMP